MSNSKKSKDRNYGLQRCLYEKRGMRRKYYKRICAALREMGIKEEEFCEVITNVQLGFTGLGYAEVEDDIFKLGRLDKEIRALEKRLNSNLLNEKGMSL